MKKIITSSLVLVLSFSVNAQETIQFPDGSTSTIYTSEIGKETSAINKSQVWSPIEKVSDYMATDLVNKDFRDMGIAVGPDSTIHMVYVANVSNYPSISRQRIMYNQKLAGGAWSSPIIIDAFDGVAERNNHEASINVSLNGDVHVVYHYWAYDGTGRNQIGYSKYTKATGVWSTELISGATGTVYATYSDYPRVASTDNNIPVVVWGTDERNGTDYDEAFLTYNNGSWQTPIEISKSGTAADSSKAQFPRAVAVGGEKVFILFREYNNAQDTLALYYRVFDASNGSLTATQKIQNSERESTSNFDPYYIFDATFNTSRNEVFIALNSQDTIVSYTYDITNATLSKNTEEYYSNISAPANYHQLSICADDTGEVHLAYNLWNSYQGQSSMYYLQYNYNTGYGVPQLFSTEDSSDEPHIVFGADDNLHIAFCDRHEDLTGDAYLRREIYYVATDISTGMFENKRINHKQLKVYPNPSSSGIFNVQLDDIMSIVVADINGKIVLQTRASKQIDISNQPNGMYFLNIRSKNGNYYSKLIK